MQKCLDRLMGLKAEKFSSVEIESPTMPGWFCCRDYETRTAEKGC